MSADGIVELASRLLELDKGDLTPREKSVIERAARRLAVSRNVNVEIQESATLGQRVADRVAEVGIPTADAVQVGIGDEPGSRAARPAARCRNDAHAAALANAPRAFSGK